MMCDPPSPRAPKGLERKDANVQDVSTLQPLGRVTLCELTATYVIQNKEYTLRILMSLTHLSYCEADELPILSQAYRIYLFIWSS